MTLNLGYIVNLGITVAFLVIVLVIQLRSEKFYAPLTGVFTPPTILCVVVTFTTAGLIPSQVYYPCGCNNRSSCFVYEYSYSSIL